MRNRVDVMHGVNFDVLDQRPGAVYGGLKLTELELRIKHFAAELGLEPRFSQTNHEGEFCELLHKAGQSADGLVLNPGAWTHYSWAIRDALDLTGIPTVEVHLSDISRREEWRRTSVFEGLELIIGQIYGKGPEGYREALELIADKLEL